ncbi:MAG TPA: OmpA family protein [Devosiaceae bacterium]|jgi:outer membrane protein OmpA-like peptidoglycan-associated protein
MRRSALNLIVGLGGAAALIMGGSLPGLAQDIVSTPSTSANSIVTLAPMPVKDYRFSAQRGAGSEAIVLDGYVPDAATRDRLLAMPNIDGSHLDLASGEPKNFDDAVSYGLDLLNHLSEGQFSLESNVMTIKGTAKTSEDYDSVRAAAATGRPDGIVMSLAEIVPPPVATPEAGTSDETAAPAAPVVPEVGSPAPVVPPAPESAGTPPAEATVGAARAPEAAPPVEAETTTAAPTNPADPAAIPSVEPMTSPEVQAAPAAPAHLLAPASPASAAPEQSPVAADYAFHATRSDKGVIALSGAVPADATRSYFGVIAGGAPDAGLTVTPGAPDDFITSGTAGLRALALLTDGKLDFAEGKWSLRGSAATGDDLNLVNALVSALPNGKAWEVNLAGPPPKEICRAEVAAFSSSHTILFQSGSAKMTPDSLASLDGLAATLQKCPEAIVHVEGYTDADGDEASNLALSVARAEAVVAALADKGAGADRLYAIGYGESLPVASNDTAAGKQANRRIVFSVVDDK